MRGNILGILFTIMSGVLIVLIIFAYSRSDRFAPEFRFSSVNTTYDSKTTDDDLLIGVNAYDAKDGDLTDRIVVEKVVINKEKETAVVYYAVADYSGNVVKQSRVFPADIKDIENFDGELAGNIEDGMFPSMIQDGDIVSDQIEEPIKQMGDGQSTESSTAVQGQATQTGN